MASKKNKNAKEHLPLSLGKLEVSKGWISVKGLFEIIKPFVNEQLKDSPHINSMEVYDLCYSWINDELETEGLKGSEKSTGVLKDILGAKKTNKIEKDVTDYLLSLPHEYWFFFCCPQLSHLKLGFRHINSDFSTIECLQRDRQLTLKNLLDHKFEDKKSDCSNGIPHGFHFRISANGFAKKEYLNSATTLAIRKFKHLFVGLLIEKKVEVGFSGSPFGATEGRLFFVNKMQPSRVQEIEIPENLGSVDFFVSASLMYKIF